MNRVPPEPLCDYGLYVLCLLDCISDLQKGLLVGFWNKLEDVNKASYAEWDEKEEREALQLCLEMRRGRGKCP